MKKHSHYYTYIVQCKDLTYYVGKTYDLERRLKQHNKLLKGGAKYTTQRFPVVLKYFEEFATDKEATTREFQLKAFTRQEKALLCKKSIIVR